MSEDLDFGATIRGMVPGQTAFGRYTLKKILGRGGMGVVWLVRDEDLERDVALKFLPEVVAGDKQAVKDLKRETRRSLDLTHSNIVRIYDFVQDDRSAAISMEYVTGDTLASLKVDQPHSHYEVATLVKWVKQLCDALSYAHGKAKVVHRDLKPANLMVDAEGDLKIADFGIAASVSDSVSQVSVQAGSSGTPVFMGPQQMMGEKPAVTDDIYSLGATLYDLLVSRPPFFSGNVMMQVMNKTPLGLQEARADLEVEGESISESWDKTILSCLSKEAVDRPQSVADVWARLNGETADLQTETAATTAATPPELLPQEGTKKHKKGAAESHSVSEDGTAVGKKVGSDRRADRDASARSDSASRSKTPMMLGLLVALGALGAAGWWFGLEQPKRQEATRLELIRQQNVATQSAAAARLAAVRIPVEVLSEPAGAAVWMDGREVGATPWSNPGGLALGEFEIELRLGGYDPQINTLDVNEQGASRWSFDLLRSTGIVNWDVQPANAKFWLHDAGPAYDEGSTADAEGLVAGGAITLPTGTYWGTISNPAEIENTVMAEHVKVEVTRDGTATLAADVRIGRLEISSNIPAGVSYVLNVITEDGNGVAYFAEGDELPSGFEMWPGEYWLNYLRTGYGISGSSPTFSVGKGETHKLTLNLRGPSIVIVPPAGSVVVDQVGNIVSTSGEFRVDDVPLGTPRTYEVRKEGFLSQSKIFDLPSEGESLFSPSNIPDDESLRGKEIRWEPELVERPPFMLSADSRHGPTSARVSMTGESKSISRTTNDGKEMAPSEPIVSNVNHEEVYQILAWDDVGHITELTVSKPEKMGGAELYQPNAVVRLKKNNLRWTASFDRGGYVHASMDPNKVESPFYPSAWLNQVVLPTQPPQMGAVWTVPVSQARSVMPWVRFIDTAGSINAKIIQIDLRAGEPWTEVEYQFDLRGSMETSVEGMVMSGESRGTLTVRVDLLRGFVTSGSMEQYFKAVVVNGKIRSESSNEGKTTFKVTPLTWASEVEPKITGNAEITPATALVKISPIYPRRALSRGTTGYVIVEYQVTVNGSVVDPKIIEAQPTGIFDEASLQAARKFKYKPATKNGQAVSSMVQNKFTFVLED